MRDVAGRAQVSLGTVSHVINDSGAVAPETRRKVMSAVRELGFEPNSSARSLKRQHVSSIGLIVPDLRNPFFALVAEGVQETTRKYDVLLVLCATDARAEREDSYARLLRGRRLDGVIYLSGTGLHPRALAELVEVGHVVFVDERLSGFDIPYVSADNRGGARRLATHVMGHGHERIAIVGGPPALWTSEQRLAGFREGVAAAGLDPDDVPVLPGDYREDSGYRAAAELLGGTRRPPSAVLCANDLMALGFMSYCREHAVRVPDDVSVTGFDDIPVAAMTSPGLTTVRQPAWEMGKAAAAALLNLVHYRAEVIEPVTFPTTLAVRDSVGLPERR